jgi:hypothetical protein
MMRKLILLAALIVLAGCESNQDEMDNLMNNIIFLHHSTGLQIWKGSVSKYMYKLTGKGDVESYFSKYNKNNKTKYSIVERAFPAQEPYGWVNYPYDYYNIWVKHAGEESYMEEPTLEMLTKDYGVIIFKHCYPVSKILEDKGIPDINSSERRLENYKLQYEALKAKMHEFPDSKFIVWTPAVHLQVMITEDEAKRTREFYNWVKDEWNEPGDNIYLWDFYNYETEGELYLKEEYAASPDDSHPSAEFAGRVAPLFAAFIIDVIEGKVEE